ncbi:TPA: type VI secretion system lipoprotein TssJ [Klebsiella aerogenes]|nr:type VI secretion system lipoprotein TssJ [Klebsiella aerogenes]HCT8622534.1 type VI secretion system lipoprotein TssJ [Klebsiella aerogenes]HCT8633967.1 type VI secretion system lipoprotein TssJ [Klebsiella aerogenes]HCT8717519.1 type VI secretion system lipoprotein TssJ [Klebsiella aerogenes]HEM8663211.1 type VI secretion system lipoprotein TssJ [Klebsiella aerogenes]
MATIAGKNCATLLPITLTAALTGCGLTQSVKDGAVSVTYAIFYKQIKTLHLDIRAREGVNHNAQGASLATVARIYQLKERKAFDASDYPSLFADDSRAIPSDWLAQKDIRLHPGESVALDMPLETAAQYVAVAGMFIAPDRVKDSWRLVLTRDDLDPDPDKPRIIEAGHNRLTLQPLKGN